MAENNKKDITDNHPVMLSMARDGFLPLVAAGYYVILDERVERVGDEDIKFIRFNLVSPSDVDLSVIDGTLAISGKVLE